MTKNVKFPLGRIVSTPGAIAAIENAGDTLYSFLLKHEAGDWGEVSQEDWERNDQALKDGSRLLSAYNLTDGTRIWIITEADRSSTTFLLPSEY